MKSLKKTLLLAMFFKLSTGHTQTTYIRTVVHVLYTDAASNIADATVLNYIDEVNKGYTKQMAAKFLRSPDIFGADWADTEIRFCLATTDPFGAATNGITHTLISNKFIPMQNPTSPENPVCNPTNYLNIYLVPVYPEPGFPDFILGGWASTPTDPRPGSTFDYVVVATNSIPTIPELIVHESGHYLGLDHVSDDALADTPAGLENISPLPGSGYSTSCTSSLQSQNTSTLAEDGTHWGGIDPPDMVENFMGLSMCCMFMFTNDQSTTMNNYITAHHSGKVMAACGSTSANEIESELSGPFHVAPNPTSGIVSILRKNETEKCTIELKDIYGKTVLTLSLNAYENTLDLSHLPNGIYLMGIAQGEDKPNVHQSRLVINR